MSNSKSQIRHHRRPSIPRPISNRSRSRTASSLLHSSPNAENASIRRQIQPAPNTNLPPSSFPSKNLSQSRNSLPGNAGRQQRNNPSVHERLFSDANARTSRSKLGDRDKVLPDHPRLTNIRLVRSQTSPTFDHKPLPIPQRQLMRPIDPPIPRDYTLHNISCIQHTRNSEASQQDSSSSHHLNVSNNLIEVGAPCRFVSNCPN